MMNVQGTACPSFLVAHIPSVKSYDNGLMSYDVGDTFLPMRCKRDLSHRRIIWPFLRFLSFECIA
jgi:hypothetical protein